MNNFRVIDLFCGCGGLSEGFRQAGYEIVMGIDINEAAIQTYNRNFGVGKGICANLLDFNQSEILKSQCIEKKVNIIIGGPPCQGFSSANRWGDNSTDIRNGLFFEYLKFVDILNPDAIVIENVRQITTTNNGYVKKKIYELFESRGYVVNHCVLNAEEYGVPQKRRRNFFVILKGKKFDFESLIKSKIVTVKEALADLYDFKKNDDGVYLGTTSRIGYLNYVRNSKYIKNHYISYPTVETQKKISYVPQGGNWRNIPEELFNTKRNNRHSSVYKRLSENEPSITIDTGNAHSNYYHPLFNRIPTVREAARLQSFPDSFVFEGSKSEQYRQVGNAVPPLLAKALALAIKEVLINE